MSYGSVHTATRILLTAIERVARGFVTNPLPHTLIWNLVEDVGLYIKGILVFQGSETAIFWKSDVLNFFTFP